MTACYLLPHPVSAADVQPYEILARMLEIGGGMYKLNDTRRDFPIKNLTDEVNSFT